VHHIIFNLHPSVFASSRNIFLSPQINHTNYKDHFAFQFGHRGKNDVITPERRAKNRGYNFLKKMQHVRLNYWVKKEGRTTARLCNGKTLA
jgi:hypothetical protein